MLISHNADVQFRRLHLTLHWLLLLAHETPCMHARTHTHTLRCAARSDVVWSVMWVGIAARAVKSPPRNRARDNTLAGAGPINWLGTSQRREEDRLVRGRWCRISPHPIWCGGEESRGYGGVEHWNSCSDNVLSHRLLRSIREECSSGVKDGNNKIECRKKLVKVGFYLFMMELALTSCRYERARLALPIGRLTDSVSIVYQWQYFQVEKWVARIGWIGIVFWSTFRLYTLYRWYIVENPVFMPFSNNHQLLAKRNGWLWISILGDHWWVQLRTTGDCCGIQLVGWNSCRWWAHWIRRARVSTLLLSRTEGAAHPCR